MPHVFFPQNRGVSGYACIPGLYYAKPQDEADGTTIPAPVQVTIPSDVSGVSQRPHPVIRNGDGLSRLYVCGGFSDNMVLTENFMFLRQGILPPPNPILNSAGSGFTVGLVASGGPGVTGNCIGYIRWWDDINQRRSPLSGASPTFALANQARTWSNLPTNAGDPSVTHIEFWVSMDGNSPRFVCRRQIGITTLVENVATLSLGIAETENFGRFPRMRFSVIWHDRQWGAGDDRFPDRLYGSSLNEPEHYPGLNLPTRMGDRIVAIVSTRDNLLIGTPYRWYSVTGYTEDDLEMNVLENDVGAIAHALQAHCHGLVFIAAPQGPYVTPGTSFSFIGQDFQKTWRDSYRRNRLAYEEGWAVNDTEENVYKLCLVPPIDFSVENPNYGGATNYWVLDYTPMIQESQSSYGRPNLSYDARQGRQDYSGAMLAVPGGRYTRAYVGSDNGNVYRENFQPTDGTLAIDFDQPWTWAVQTKHYFPTGAGGSRLDGNKYPSFWNYSTLDAYNLDLYVGDEDARSCYQPQYHEGVVDEDPVDPVTGSPLVLKTTHFAAPGISGRGITAEMWRTFAAPAVHPGRWSGIGFTFEPGVNTRQPTTPGGGG